MGRRFLYFLGLVFLPFISAAQGGPSWGIIPSVSLTGKLPRDWYVNLKAESRQALYQDGFAHDYLLTDLGVLFGKKASFHTTLAAGYLVRIREEEVFHRAIQQLSLARRYAGLSLSHRILSDQTFSGNEAAEYRLRYRISSEIPLEGQSLDPGEFFLKLSHEYVNSLQAKEYDLEIRTASFLGYVFTPKNKLEVGLEHRVDSFVSARARHRLWIGLHFYQSI